MAFIKGTYNIRPAMTGYMYGEFGEMGGLDEFGMGNYEGLGKHHHGGGGHHGGGHHGGGGYFYPGGAYQYDWGPSQVEIIVAEDSVCKSCREGRVTGPACNDCGPKVP